MFYLVAKKKTIVKTVVNPTVIIDEPTIDEPVVEFENIYDTVDIVYVKSEIIANLKKQKHLAIPGEHKLT